MTIEAIPQILFLDDRSKRLRAAIDKWGDQVTLVPTAKEAIKLLANECWDKVYLDHDLNFEEFVDSDRKDCGMEVVRYLIKYREQLEHLHETMFIIHSSNLPAGLLMADALNDAGYKAYHSRWEYDDEP